MQNNHKHPLTNAARNSQTTSKHQGLVRFAEEVGQQVGRYLAAQERERNEHNQTSNRAQTGRKSRAV